MDRTVNWFASGFCNRSKRGWGRSRGCAEILDPLHSISLLLRGVFWTDTPCNARQVLCIWHGLPTRLRAVCHSVPKLQECGDESRAMPHSIDNHLHQRFVLWAS